MEETLRQVLSITIGMLCALFGAGCLSILAVKFWRWVPTVGLWRLKRLTLVVLLGMSVLATIEAQKRTGGEGTSGSPSSQTEPDGGDSEPPPLRDAPTNTLHFAAISTGTNAVSLTLAWPPELFVPGTVLDLFAATSLVETVWDWQCAHTVADGETNWMATVGHDGGARFFLATERADPGDMRDTDGDGIPDAYELRKGTNPYVDDYAAAPKLTVGPNGPFTNIEDAIASSIAYSIVELDPSVQHDIYGRGLGCKIPAHPIMVTAPRPYAVVRSAWWSAFLLDTNTTSRTVFRNLYLLLDARDSFQAGFWCGGNLPWSGVPASATFQNVYVRMPNPGVRYRAWNFHRSCDDVASILDCTVNAAGSDEAVAIYATGSPPLLIDGCSFVNFPPNNGPSTVAGVILQTGDCSDGGSSVTVSRTVFDETFTNALPFCRFDSAKPYALAVSDCIVPSPLADRYAPDETSGLIVTNASLSWSGVPHSSSPSVALGIGSLSPVENDPSADADGDGLSDYAEAYEHGTDPFLADSDNDGDGDWHELQNGTDPTNPHSFTQTLTVTVTNTAAPSHPVYVAWGFSATNWETNGLASFPDGSGSTNYVDVSSQGAAYVKAFCDLNENGEYDADWDILLVREIPYGSTAKVSFAFGDVDVDGVTDAQERADGTDPYDTKSFRMSVMVKVTNEDNVQSITNFLSWGHSSTGWETNGLVSFAKLDVQSRSMFISDVVTNGNIYVKCYRDLNRNGVYDSGEDAFYVKQIGSGYNGGEYSFAIGDFDGDEIPDSVELDEGTDPINGRSYCFNMSATVTGIFQTTNQLTLAATFGDATLCGPVVMATNVWTMDFGHLLATNGEKVVLTFWDDANSNGVREAEETAVNLILPVTNHTNACSRKLSYGAFDADGNNLPDWWEVVTGLAECTGPHGEFDDADGDGLINLHEFWAGCNPLVPDGSNTLLSVAARSIDDRIVNAEPDIAMPKFVDYASNGSNGVFVLNTNCWAVDMDTSCASMWQNYAPTAGDEMRRAATLISPRHVIGALHYPQIGGSQCWFRGKSGTIYVRTLLRSASLSQPNTDIRIGLLNEELPTNDVSPAAILPANYYFYIGDGTRLPCLVVDQEEKMIVQDIQLLPSQSFTSLLTGMRPMNHKRNSFYEDVVGGDSSSPRFLVIENRVVLLNVMWQGGGGSGSFVTLYKDLIQNAMDSLCSGYQLETIDLTTYQPLDWSGGN